MSLAAFDPQELRRFTQTFEDLFNTGDPVSMTSYYTEHAHLMGDRMQPIQGHAAITQFWREAITRTAAAQARRTIQLHESHSSGNLGYALCTVKVELPPAPATPARPATARIIDTTEITSTGATITGTGTTGTVITVWDATIWHRDPDGIWRIAVDISTPLPPASPS
jgi:ketosteroid isomerase-like protein